MVKKIISFLCSFLLLFCLIPCDVFADDVLDVCPNCGERTYSTWRDVSISVSEALGLPFSIKAKSCSKCHYQYYDWNLFGFADYHDYVGDESLIINYLRQWADKILGKDASASKFEAGGGSSSPGGVGRNPVGYAGEGTPNISPSGSLYMVATPYFVLSSNRYFNWMTYKTDTFSNEYLFLNPKGIVNGERAFSALGQRMFTCHGAWKITAPYDGIYYINIMDSEQELGYCNMYAIDSSKSKSYNFTSGHTTNPQNKYFLKVYAKKGESVYWFTGGDLNGSIYSSKLNYCEYSINPLIISYEPDNSTIVNQTNITINNNTWNGNIYVDSSNKLTYIYPQYTVNNETKISNNPIIYNQETKQYYTYDQTTNNYYYITYGDPAPTPTPSPSPDPGGSGGGSSGGDGSGGGSGDTPSGGGSSWWEKLLDKLGSALIDGLLDAIKGILKLLFDLFSSILGWIIWLCSKVFDLFPFLPPGVGALLVGGVVVCFILAFIKFIRG